MDGELKYLHVVWIPAIPAGMTGFVTLVYNDERSSVGIHPAMLLRWATLERHITSCIPTPERENDATLTLIQNR